MMRLDEFRSLAETWGGDIERWPQERRREALALSTMPAAQAILASEREVDVAFSRRPDVSADRARKAAYDVMLRIAAQNAKPPSLWRRLEEGFWIPLGGFACAAALGIALALVVAPPLSAPGDTVVLAKILDSTSVFGGLEVR